MSVPSFLRRDGREIMPATVPASLVVSAESTSTGKRWVDSAVPTRHTERAPRQVNDEGREATELAVTSRPIVTVRKPSFTYSSWVLNEMTNGSEVTRVVANWTGEGAEGVVVYRHSEETRPQRYLVRVTPLYEYAEEPEYRCTSCVDGCSRCSGTGVLTR